MKIDKRIVICFTVLGASVSLSCLVAMTPIRARLTTAGDIHVPALNAIQSLDADLKGAVEESFAYVVSGMESEKEEFNLWADGFDEQLQRFAALAHRAAPGDPQEALLLERIIYEQPKMVVFAKLMFSEQAAIGFVSQATFEAYEESIESLESDIEKWVSIERGEVIEAQKRAMATLHNAVQYLIGIALGTLLASIVVGTALARSITRPISKLSITARRVGRGNLDCRANLDAHDEIGQLGGAFDKMTEALKVSREVLNARLEEETNDHTKLKHAEKELRANSLKLTEALEGEKYVKLELESAMSRLELAATTDTLTGLPNRAVLMDRLGQVLKRSNRDGSRFAVLFFDFDRFKVINDSLGHDMGDALLCSIADILRREIRESDTVARFGGDEFVILLDCLSEWSDADKKAAQLLDALAKPHDISGHRIVSSASIGLVTNDHGHKYAADMLRDADVAMYRAKGSGGSRVVMFDRIMHEQAMSRLSLEAKLRFAIAENQLRLVYQPIVELATGSISGFEALIRWDHPERGVVYPTEFIPIAEETGLIIEIGKWVLRTACRQVADWNHRLGLKRKLSMNVNVSKRQLLHPSLVDDTLEYLQEFNLPAEYLKLEITESAIADERIDVVTLLTQFRKHGLQIAMDDFGTGSSSLGALHEYPIDELKIDQLFIRSLDGDRSLLAVVASITALAENLGIKTVAEGIEKLDTIAALQSIGCTLGQGFYFAKPMTPADAEDYLLGIQQEKRGA